jgi:hemerythrin-like domain-containing protein
VCDYCGCQALGAIAALTAEHDAVVNLSGEARRAEETGDLELAADRARAIAAVLAPHTVVEETALFPAMAEDYGDHVEGLLEEHRIIELVLSESAQVTPIDPTWPDRLKHTLWVLREHILKEEDGVFPAALATLGAREWELIEAARATAESATDPSLVG